jgi:myo-inositol-1(or 4)-monophosphatase
LTKAADALPALLAAARAAGEAAMAWFRPGAQTSAVIAYKAGDSPVSEADLAANAVLERELRRRFPDCGWISEETTVETPAAGARLIIVDPIDGTRAFIAGDPQWSVSVALVAGSRPIAGVVHAPAMGVTYSAATGRGAHRGDAAIHASGWTSFKDSTLAGPRPLIDVLEQESGASVRRAQRTPSLALRLARAAEGEFDCALASEGAHVWDVAAADVLLAEAGGALLDAAGAPLRYTAADLRQGRLAGGSPALAAEAMRLIGLRR